ncbi:MAG: hypothetical protein H0T42_34085 [Deltaproteobacteria bacterium]|nr:hypothetical protein [Deltaproteobacteria bacterium]
MVARAWCGATMVGIAVAASAGCGRLGFGPSEDKRAADAATDGASSGGCVDEVSMTSRTTCATTSGGTIWCWGANDKGEVGDGTLTGRAAIHRQSFGQPSITRRRARVLRSRDRTVSSCRLEGRAAPRRHGILPDHVLRPVGRRWPTVHRRLRRFRADDGARRNRRGQRIPRARASSRPRVRGSIRYGRQLLVSAAVISSAQPWIADWSIPSIITRTLLSVPL